VCHNGTLGLVPTVQRDAGRDGAGRSPGKSFAPVFTWGGNEAPAPFRERGPGSSPAGLFSLHAAGRPSIQGGGVAAAVGQDGGGSAATAIRLAAIPLLINISVAILSTKIPILLGHGFWTFTLAKLPSYGFLSMMHEARTDFCMFLGLLFLLLVGGGRCSLDARLGTDLEIKRSGTGDTGVA